MPLMCSLDCYHSEVESGSFLRCYPFLDHPAGHHPAFRHQGGLSKDRLCEVLYGPEKSDGLHDAIRTRAALHIHVLRPLCWMGLLEEVRIGEGFEREEHYFKAAIWHKALKLETDAHLNPVTQH